MIEPEKIVERIEDAIDVNDVEIADLTGTRDHYELEVVSSEFEGKPLIQRHRIVYDALSDEMEGPIHALKLETKTPDED
jgi:stress-induced morphogen